MKKLKKRPDSAKLFRGTAVYYARHRRPYPTKLFTDIIKYFKLDGTGTLVDLGYGTGEITVPLAPYFSKVIGADPSPDMLREAKKRAAKGKIKNVEWRLEVAEKLKIKPASLKLVTAGVSFHWMNQELMHERIYKWLAPGGGMVVILEGSPVRGKNKTEAWRIKRQEIIAKYLGPDRRAGDALHKDYIPHKRPYEEVIRESAFKAFEKKTYRYKTERTIDEIIGFLYSTSYAAKRLFGKRAPAFEREMRHELLKMVPSGVFIEPGETILFLARKSFKD